MTTQPELKKFYKTSEFWGIKILQMLAMASDYIGLIPAPLLAANPMLLIGVKVVLPAILEAVNMYTRSSQKVEAIKAVATVAVRTTPIELPVPVMPVTGTTAAPVAEFTCSTCSTVHKVTL